MFSIRISAFIILLPVFCSAAAPVAMPAAGRFKELEQKRIDQIAAMLPDKPVGYGRPCADRAFWEDPKLRKRLGSVVGQAEKLLTQTFPEWSDADYLEFTKVGTREAGQKMQGRRSGWLYPLVMAECVDNKGRFIEKLNMVLGEYAAERTWTMPAHDRSLDNFNRKTYSVDLRSSAFGQDLAQALYLLGDKVTPETRTRLTEALEQRVFAPVRRSLETGKGNGWLGSKTSPVQNNWNVVCLAGVSGAAMAVLPDRKERAMFLAAGEHYSRYYLNGVWDDGYCDEGVGYWNYGFGSFLHLREIVMYATGGRVDLLVEPKIRNAALYGERIQIIEGSVPPFADCHSGTRPASDLLHYCDWVLGLGLGHQDPPGLSSGNLSTVFMAASPCKARSTSGAKEEGHLALRSYFEKAGVLVCRPATGSVCRLGVAIKAGGNGSHSHNDVGSFVIALGKEQPVGEPGGPHAYTSQTFSKDRFKLKLLNSFGHPVPVVAGTLQLEATKVHPKVLSTNFTAQVDEICMDMACAYKVPELQKLQRTMRYERAGAGLVTITDEVVLSAPSSFELGLPTNGKWKQVGPNALEFSMGKERVLAEIETPDGFEMTCEMIEEQSKPAFPRLGIKLKKPVQSAKVTVRFRPAP